MIELELNERIELFCTKYEDFDKHNIPREKINKIIK